MIDDKAVAGAQMDESGKKSYWSQYATVYDEGVDYVVGQSLRLALASRLARERQLGEVLECGCGTGFYTRVIAGHAKQVTATDISPEMLEIACHNLASFLNVSYCKVPAEETPFAPRAFDTVLLANILNTVPDPLKVLRECFRVLKYDGLLIVIVYTDYGMEAEEKTGLGLRYFQKFGFPPSWGLQNYSPGELRGLVRQAGFLVKSIQVLGKSPKALYLKAVKCLTRTKSTVTVRPLL